MMLVSFVLFSAGGVGRHLLAMEGVRGRVGKLEKEEVR
jgi:hypothetical protein